MKRGRLRSNGIRNTRISCAKIWRFRNSAKNVEREIEVPGAKENQHDGGDPKEAAVSHFSSPIIARVVIDSLSRKHIRVLEVPSRLGGTSVRRAKALLSGG